MSVHDQLLALQWVQLKHDETYHKDVVILPLAQRMKHMALHNAKYTAYLLDAADQIDDDRFVQILTDTFIICLASANTLNQDLGREVAPDDAASLQVLGATLATRFPRKPNDPLWIVRQYTRHNGRLAKLCESWDHLEMVPFRDGMKECNRALLAAVLAEAAARGLDLARTYHTRIRVVETRSIFDGYFREGAWGEA